MKWYVWVSMVLMGLVAFSAVFISNINGADTYNGQINFATENAYSAFKQELINTNANYFSGSNPPSVYVDVLNQQPPILIKFQITVDKGVNFSYGTKSTALQNSLIKMVAVTLAAMFAAFIVWLFILIERGD
jgi:hypothetical protein